MTSVMRRAGALLATMIVTMSAAARTQTGPYSLEQLLARSKRLRDTEAASLNMQMLTWRDSDGVNRAFRAGAGDALRTWRQP